MEERIDRCDIINGGKGWELRKDLWEELLVNGKFDYRYNERMMDVIKGLIRLVKDDNESGKGVLGILNGDMEGLDRDWYDGSRGIGWCMYYKLVMGENGKGEKVLEIWYEERSWEFVSEFGNDV